MRPARYGQNKVNTIPAVSHRCGTQGQPTRAFVMCYGLLSTRRRRKSESTVPTMVGSITVTLRVAPVPVSVTVAEPVQTDAPGSSVATILPGALR